MPRRPRRSHWTTRTEQVVSTAPKPRRALASALGLGATLIVVLGFVLFGQRDASVFDGAALTPGDDASSRPPPPPAGPDAPQDPLEPKLPPTGAAVPELYAQRPPNEAEAARSAAQRSAQNLEQRRRFDAAAAAPADAAAPDPGLVALDPSLLATRERELRVALETNALAEDQFENAALIALEAAEARTRFAAIQALGRAKSPYSQELLMDLFDQAEDIVERRMILGYVRPEHLGDASVDWLASKLSAPELTPDLKKQMTFSLVLAELAEARGQRQADLTRLMQRVPPEWHQELVETYRTLTR